MRGPLQRNPTSRGKTSTLSLRFCQCGEQNTSLRCRILVPAVRVFFPYTSGDHSRAPRLGIPGRGLHQLHGHRRSNFSPARTPLGAAIRFSCQPRHRMGLRGTSRHHARHQHQRHVHRVGGPALGWRWLYRKPSVGPSCQNHVFREARRTGSRHGRFRIFSRGTAGNLQATHIQACEDATLNLTVYSPA